jgi:acetyl/propionyl-CoA carboxylase alpha subunit
VPTVPGSQGLITNDEEALSVADTIGFPLMIKATAGGGGRGMRLATKMEDFLPLLKQAQQEAEAAFGNGAVYIERYVVNPRHIEFQVLADKFGNVVHLGERDCSIQRRNQKLLEEAPSPALTPEVRNAKNIFCTAQFTRQHWSPSGIQVGLNSMPAKLLITHVQWVQRRARTSAKLVLKFLKFNFK